MKLVESQPNLETIFYMISMSCSRTLVFAGGATSIRLGQAPARSVFHYHLFNTSYSTRHCPGRQRRRIPTASIVRS